MEDNTQNTQQPKNYTALLVSIVVVIIVAIIGGALLLGSGNDTSTQQDTASTPAANALDAPNAPTDTANTTTTTSSNTYTLADVSQHNSKDSCWMVVSGQVYDVTSYVNAHPGGRDILKGCGIDATSLYDTQGGEGAHSSTAHKLLENFVIGSLSN